MSWAAMRETTRLEDRAYCLLGLFSINMTLMYGEGERAFISLQEELVKSGSDLSVLAWHQWGHGYGSDLFAKSPADFAECSDIICSHRSNVTCAMTNIGFRIEQPWVVGLAARPGISSQMALHLGCKRRAAFTRGITLPLALLNPEDGIFRISDEYGGMRGRTFETDATDSQPSSKWPRITIVRHDHSMEGASNGTTVEYHTYLWVKFLSLASIPWQVLKAHPESCWNSNESCIDLSLTEKNSTYPKTRKHSQQSCSGIKILDRSGSLLLRDPDGDILILQFQQRFKAKDETFSEKISFEVSAYLGRFPVPFDDPEKWPVFVDKTRRLYSLRSIKKSGLSIAELIMQIRDRTFCEPIMSMKQAIAQWPQELEYIQPYAC